MTDADILWFIEFDLNQDPEWVVDLEWTEAYWQWLEDTYDPDN